MNTTRSILLIFSLVAIQGIRAAELPAGVTDEKKIFQDNLLPASGYAHLNMGAIYFSLPQELFFESSYKERMDQQLKGFIHLDSDKKQIYVSGDGGQQTVIATVKTQTNEKLVLDVVTKFEGDGSSYTLERQPLRWVVTSNSEVRTVQDNMIHLKYDDYTKVDLVDVFLALPQELFDESPLERMDALFRGVVRFDPDKKQIYVPNDEPQQAIVVTVKTQTKEDLVLEVATKSHGTYALVRQQSKWAATQVEQSPNRIAIAVIRKYFSPPDADNVLESTDESTAVKGRLNALMISDQVSEEARLCYAIKLIDDKIHLAHFLKSGLAPSQKEAELLMMRDPMINRLNELSPKF